MPVCVQCVCTQSRVQTYCIHLSHLQRVLCAHIRLCSIEEKARKAQSLLSFGLCMSSNLDMCRSQCTKSSWQLEGQLNLQDKTHSSFTTNKFSRSSDRDKQGFTSVKAFYFVPCSVFGFQSQEGIPQEKRGSPIHTQSMNLSVIGSSW